MSDRRVLSLDVLRGFALLGILFGNLTWFTGWAVLSPEDRASLFTAPLDSAVAWAVHFAVDGKFYGIFALLFGAGFAIQWRRSLTRGENARVLLLRRLAILFGIGFLHAVFLWFGDIVSIYAVMGLGLIPLAGCAGKTLLRWAAVLFVLPILVATAWLAFPAGEVGYGPAALLTAFGSGTAEEAFVANWAFLEERWFLALYSGRPFKLLGLFVLGFWATRTGLALAPDQHRPLLRRLRALGLGLGIPLNVALAILVTLVPDRPPSPAGLLRASVDAIAVPVLAIGYSAALLLLLEKESWRRRLSWMAAPGRMTLTCYLMQSALGIALFYGCGLGLWGELGAVWIVPLALGVFALQVAFSSVWLRRFRQGPVEWIWRRTTYGRAAGAASASPSPAGTAPGSCAPPR